MSLESYVAVLLIIFISVFLQETETYRHDLESIITQRYENTAHSRNKRNAGDEELLYTSSKVFPRQISVLNSSAQVGVVVDSVGEKVAILNGETGRGVVIDKPLRMGVMVERGGWLMIQQDLKSYLRDCNVSALMDMNAMNSFQLDEQQRSSEASKLVESNLVYFGDGFVSRLLEAQGNLITLAMDLFGFVMHPLKNVLGPVINIFMEGWVVIKGGILALLNIFFWMGKLVSFVAGGFMKLVAKLVRFPLTLIITAIDGARAFFYMLKELTINFDLISILNNVLSIPAQIAHFVAGLGGEVAQGITGVFNLVAKMFDFTNSGITMALQGFMNILLRFFGKARPNFQEVQRSASQLLSVADDQEKRYKNDFGPYRKFLSSVGGTGNFQVGGVGVGNMVRVLTQTKESGTNQVTGVMNVLKPLIPYGQSIPQLLVGMVRMLNTTDGASYLENIIPSIKVPKESLRNANNNLLGATLRTAPYDHSIDYLKTLPASDLLKRLPVVSSIYRELDNAAQKYDNTSLDEMLLNHEVAAELVEVTTRALEMAVN